MTGMTTSIPFASEIAAAAAHYRLDSRLLAAVAAQETGGPGSNGAATLSATAATVTVYFR